MKGFMASNSNSITFVKKLPIVSKAAIYQHLKNWSAHVGLCLNQPYIHRWCPWELMSFLCVCSSVSVYSGKLRLKGNQNLQCYDSLYHQVFCSSSAIENLNINISMSPTSREHQANSESCLFLNYLQIWHA